MPLTLRTSPQLALTRHPPRLNIRPPSGVTGQQLRGVDVPPSLLPESITLPRSPSLRDLPGSASDDAAPPNPGTTCGHGSPFGRDMQWTSDITDRQLREVITLRRRSRVALRSGNPLPFRRRSASRLAGPGGRTSPSSPLPGRSLGPTFPSRDARSPGLGRCSRWSVAGHESPLTPGRGRPVPPVRVAALVIPRRVGRPVRASVGSRGGRVLGSFRLWLQPD